MSSPNFEEPAIQLTTENLISLCESATHIIPDTVGKITEMRPAVIHTPQDGRPNELYIGEQYMLIGAFAHSRVVGKLKPNKRISAVQLVADTGMHLAVNYEPAEMFGGFDIVTKDIEQGYESVFYGGFSDREESSEEVRAVCSVGLIREASNWLTQGYNYELGMHDTKMLLGISVDRLARGEPISSIELMDYLGLRQ